MDSEAVMLYWRNLVILNINCTYNLKQEEGSLFQINLKCNIMKHVRKDKVGIASIKYNFFQN